MSSVRRSRWVCCRAFVFACWRRGLSVRAQKAVEEVNVRVQRIIPAIARAGFRTATSTSVLETCRHVNGMLDEMEP